MATLKDLFEEKSQDIYKRFSAREEPSSQPYISILPDSNDSRSRIKNDSRALPVISTLRDTQRVSKFLRSSDGLLFIAKQTLLQTGNTFASTRLYNPASPLLNTIPFLHTRRHISTEVLAPNGYGLLQNTTVNTIASKYTIQGALQAVTTDKRSLLPTIGSIAKTYLGMQVKNAVYRNVPIPQRYLNSRPESKVFSKFGPVVFDPQPLDQRGLPRINVESSLKNLVISKARSTITKIGLNSLNKVLPKPLKNTPILATVQRELSLEEEKIPSFIDAAKKFKDSFYQYQRDNFFDNKSNRLQSKYFEESGNVAEDNPFFFNPLRQGFGQKKSKTEIKDPYNKRILVSSTDANKINYDNIIKEQSKSSDIIKFIFKDVEGNNPVHFRALISSIKESIKTEFNEQRYVGRTERFVTYGGAKRGLTLSFNIVAFSSDEADSMWSRVNYLSGLAFPKSVTNGFMVPPLFKLTVGRLYDNQPCYIESLDYDFLDESITFDVNREVPFAINVQMQLSILEKRSKFFDSPFYKITEEIVDLQYATPSEERARVLTNTLLDVSSQIDANINSSNTAFNTAQEIARTNPNAFLRPLG